MIDDSDDYNQKEYPFWLHVEREMPHAYLFFEYKTDN